MVVSSFILNRPRLWCRGRGGATRGCGGGREVLRYLSLELRKWGPHASAAGSCGPEKDRHGEPLKTTRRDAEKKRAEEPGVNPTIFQLLLLPLPPTRRHGCAERMSPTRVKWAWRLRVRGSFPSFRPHTHSLSQLLSPRLSRRADASLTTTTDAHTAPPPLPPPPPPSPPPSNPSRNPKLTTPLPLPGT